MRLKKLQKDLLKLSLPISGFLISGNPRAYILEQRLTLYITVL
jgi:hypothetical protein